jgi:hypothetical protein
MCKVTQKREKSKKKCKHFFFAFPSASNFGVANVTKKREKSKKKCGHFFFAFPSASNFGEANVRKRTYTDKKIRECLAISSKPPTFAPE